MPVRVVISDAFKKDARTLAKRFPQIERDIEPLVDQLLNGETPGAQISGVGFTVFKARVKSSDRQSGKSGGYRVIYYLKTAACIYLVAIYSKTRQDNIDSKSLRRLITDILSDTELPC